MSEQVSISKWALATVASAAAATYLNGLASLAKDRPTAPSLPQILELKAALTLVVDLLGDEAAPALKILVKE